MKIRNEWHSHASLFEEAGIQHKEETVINIKDI